jgi:hypothetical protein
MRRAIETEGLQRTVDGLSRSRPLDRRPKQDPAVAEPEFTPLYLSYYAPDTPKKRLREATRSLPEIFNLTVLVANDHRVARIDYRSVEYTFIFTLEQKRCLVL